MTYLQKVRAGVVLMLLTLVAIPSALAHAADKLPVNPTDTLASVRVSASVVQLAIGALIPVAVALLTHVNTSALTKGLLDLVLNAVSALIVQSQLADGSAVFEKSAIIVWFVGLVGSVVGYYKIWKPAKVTSSLVPVKTVDPVTKAPTLVYVPGKLANVGRKSAYLPERLAA